MDNSLCQGYIGQSSLLRNVEKSYTHSFFLFDEFLPTIAIIIEFAS